MGKDDVIKVLSQKILRFFSLIVLILDQDLGFKGELSVLKFLVLDFFYIFCQKERQDR